MPKRIKISVYFSSLIKIVIVATFSQLYKNFFKNRIFMKKNFFIRKFIHKHKFFFPGKKKLKKKINKYKD
jgi:hypothetical protein